MTVYCDGHLEVLIADESSMRCTKCDWSGWPRQDVEKGTGRILRIYPHEYKWYPWLHSEAQRERSR